jgi:hypothetical protein
MVRLRKLAHELGAKDVTESGDMIRLRFGSRLQYRLWGAFTRYGRRNLPLRVEFQIPRSQENSTVIMVFESDGGAYVARTAASQLEYDRRWNQMTRAVTGTLSPGKAESM